MKGFGFFLVGLLLQTSGFRPALWLMAGMLAAILAGAATSLPRELGNAKASKSFQELVAKSRGVNLLAASTRLRARQPEGAPVSAAAHGEAAIQRRRAAMGTFERYLTLWVALCIVVDIALGSALPRPFRALGRLEVAQVNIPVALLIWAMIVPMLLRVDFGAMERCRRQGRCPWPVG